jgi:hypothetical protein
MPRIRSMTSKKDCHSEPSFLSSLAKRLCHNYSSGESIGNFCGKKYQKVSKDVTKTRSDGI